MSDSGHSLPWLERLAMRVPGYQGYHARAHRRTADVALRSAITLRLDEAHERIEPSGLGDDERDIGGEHDKIAVGDVDQSHDTERHR